MAGGEGFAGEVEGDGSVVAVEGAGEGVFGGAEEGGEVAGCSSAPASRAAFAGAVPAFGDAVGGGLVKPEDGAEEDWGAVVVRPVAAVLLDPVEAGEVDGPLVGVEAFLVVVVSAFGDACSASSGEDGADTVRFGGEAEGEVGDGHGGWCSPVCGWWVRLAGV